MAEPVVSLINTLKDHTYNDIKQCEIPVFTSSGTAAEVGIIRKNAGNRFP